MCVRARARAPLVPRLVLLLPLQCLAATGDVDALRSARLHACEGAKLTGYTNAYALTTLADVCWLHARAVAASSRRSATSGATEERATYTAERVTLKSWLNRADAVARDASSAAAAWPAAITATPQSAAWVAAALGEDSTHVKEDADLLAFAAKKLAALRASPSSSQASAFERVEMACLHASNIARVAACAAALKA
ncbi:hypothetical protein EON68_01995 [archaeon]|nr:MAG: hypothetical protein EON68_01995 [archaeon]